MKWTIYLNEDDGTYLMSNGMGKIEVVSKKEVESLISALKSGECPHIHLEEP